MTIPIRSPTRLLESAAATPATSRLLETATLTFERLAEADGKPARMKVRGVAGQANIVNANGRYYPLDVVRAAVEAAQERIGEGQMTMLQEHPEWDEPETGELDDVAARITALRVDETGVITYEAILVQNECGQNIAALLDAGVKVQASTRANGTGEVVPAGDLNVPGLDAGTPVYKVTAMTYLGVDFTLNPAVASTDAALTESQVAPPPAPPEEEPKMDLNELKTKHPDLVKALLAESQKAATDASVEAELARLKAENDKLKQDSLQSVRKGIVSKALSEAALPKLGNAGDINLDERFERQVESAALDAASDADAQAAVTLLITERRALLGQNPAVKTDAAANRAGLPAGNTEKALTDAKDATDKAALAGVQGARSLLGL